MYSLDEVRALVEGYRELRTVADTRRKVWILHRLIDLDTAISHMLPKEYQAVLLCGLLGLPDREVGMLLGVHHSTVQARYESGLMWITNYLNGSNRH